MTDHLPAKLNIFAVHDLDTGDARHVLDTLMDIDGLPPELTREPWHPDQPLPWSSRTIGRVAAFRG